MSISTLSHNISSLVCKAPTATKMAVRAEESVRFKTEGEAMDYAKGRVMDALHSPVPYERGVVVNGNTVVREVEGAGNQVNFGQDIIPKDSVIVHGHPQYTPISITDMTGLRSASSSSIIAYNPNGEYSKMSLVPKTWGKWLPKKIREYLYKCYEKGNAKLARKEYNQYMSSMDKGLKEQATKVGQELQELYGSSDEATQKIIRKYLKKYQKDSTVDPSDLPENVKQIFDKLVQLDKKETEAKIPLTHKFWQEKAPEYGVKYETNYSYLA